MGLTFTSQAESYFASSIEKNRRVTGGCQYGVAGLTVDRKFFPVLTADGLILELFKVLTVIKWKLVQKLK